ncbi:MAG TPA: N-acetylmuramoyl-L-alanine amidase [Terriglobales bacterium]|nr:N-acetylmuramoyl-L-alanine amidase [Terriglobales bacterium]
MAWLPVAAVLCSPLWGRGQAADPLSEAHAMHRRLLETPAAERSAADYEAIVAVLAPLKTKAASPDSDSARFETASLYVAMARDLDAAAGYTQAARAFLDLLHVSPYTAYRRNAEWALAQIQIYHLRQPAAAAVWLRDFVRRYPADPRVDTAQREIRGQRLPEPDYLETPAVLPPVPASTPPPAAAAAATAAAAGKAEAAGAGPAPAPGIRVHSLTVNSGNVSRIQVLTNAHSTSVVVSLRHEVTFSRGPLPGGAPSIYFDVSNAGAPARKGTAAAWNLVVGDGRVQRVRVTRQRLWTRIVIEPAGQSRIDRGRIFPNPSRLIVGVSEAPHAAAGADGVHRPDTAPAPAAAAQLAEGGSTLTRALGLKIGTVVIDAGHGGHDTGTIAANGLEEKTVVLDVAQRLGRLLRTRLGVAVVYTRDSDVFVPLDQRTAIANHARADLFLSIHANSSPDTSARGMETYYLDLTDNRQALAVAARENAGSDRDVHDLSDMVRTIALKDKMQESHELARDLQRSLSRASGEEDRGVKSAPFVVLIGAQMPSVLAEISFLSNAADAHRLSQAAYRARLAEALYQGVRDYVHSLSRATASVAALSGPR